MLEVTQELLEKVDPLLDADDSEAAGKLLVDADPTSLRALLIHILRDRGPAVADQVGEAYLREQKAARVCRQPPETQSPRKHSPRRAASVSSAEAHRREVPALAFLQFQRLFQVDSTEKMTTLRQY